MIFASLPLAEAEGAIVAHAVRRDGLVLKKGERVTAEALAKLAAAGVREIVVAKLEAGDLGEDEAARRLAEAIAGEGLAVERAFTGRANLFARRAGLFLPDATAIDRVNALDEAVTIATLPAFKPVQVGEMVATVKIIPFAVPSALIAKAVAEAGGAMMSVSPWRAMKVGVISTLLPGLKPGVVDKTVQTLGKRIAPAGAKVIADERVAHDPDALAKAIAKVAPFCDLLVVFGASAITDRRDVIPAALEQAGGAVLHFGMPVDPGNLLLVGSLGDKTVLGAPGCARSPRENGFDWVLDRVLAGVAVTSQDIRRMGVGGLLMEIVSRPQPRAGGESHDDE